MAFDAWKDGWPMFRVRRLIGRSQSLVIVETQLGSELGRDANEDALLNLRRTTRTMYQ